VRITPESARGAPVSQAVQPVRRVAEILAANDLHTQVQERDIDTTNRRRCQRSVIQRLALDQEIAESRHPPDAVNLRPQLPSKDREVQAAYRLPLDDRAITDFVVTGQEAPGLDLESKPFEVSDDRSRLSSVDNDVCHIRSFNPNVCRVSADSVSKARELALSRSESA
jgi:hypothetical protein